MIFFYIEGAEMPVTEERALRQVKDGLWFECTAAHTFNSRPEWGDNECIRVFHREFRPKKVRA